MSIIVTIAVAKLTLPDESVATKITVFGPTFAAPKVLGVKVKVKPQLSKEPLFTNVGLTVTCPFGPSGTVTFCVITTGIV